MDFDHSVPASGNDGAVVAAVAKEADFTFLGIMLIEHKRIDT